MPGYSVVIDNNETDCIVRDKPGTSSGSYIDFIAEFGNRSSKRP